MRERGRIRGEIIDDGEMGNDGLCRPLGGFVVFHFLTRFIVRSKNRLELFVCSFAWDGHSEKVSFFLFIRGSFVARFVRLNPPSHRRNRYFPPSFE